MTISVLFLCLFVDGVFGVETVSGMEGQNVTLYTHGSDIQTADLILWVFVSKSTRIAQNNIAARKISIYDDVLDGRFRHRLMLDRHTGSLTITNIRTTDSGLYALQIVRGTDVNSRSFSIIVSAHLPFPHITSDCPQNSSSISKCVLLCSVMNVTRVSLSWYKGKSLLSSISVSDLNIRLSLPLEVEYQDTNTYRCVVNNPISNHTQHLNITQLCHKCSEFSGVGEEQVLLSQLTVLMGSLVVAALVVGAAGMIFCIYKRLKKTDQHGLASGEENIKLNGKRKTETDGVKYIKVKAGEPVQLDTGVTDIQRFDLIQWKFGKLGDATSPFIPISRINKNNEELQKNDVIEKLGDRLNVIGETRSITIENSKTTDTGLYKLEIDSTTDQICKSFFVTVSE
ncbi:uncharacterized protein LOC130549010 [Triplophysa rosa]|uniref:uncharacterized protein LOC130549010 n=1 Tax=Triplophysa rosa TaxID=992332 RepID=UPI002545E71F|nr:uncharacterized protein LOC130549010 [Triplophysa rosa]